MCEGPVETGVHAQLWQCTLCAAALRGKASEFVQQLGRIGCCPGQRQRAVLEMQQNGRLIEQADCAHVRGDNVIGSGEVQALDPSFTKIGEPVDDVEIAERVGRGRVGWVVEIGSERARRRECRVARAGEPGEITQRNIAVERRG